MVRLQRVSENLWYVGVGGFNTIMVRLQRLLTQTQAPAFLSFQYHNGSIATLKKYGIPTRPKGVSIP